MGWLNQEALDDVPLMERIESFIGGMDAFVRPTLLGPTQSARLQNCLCEDNHIARTRYGTAHIGNAYPDATGGAKIQGMIYYDTPSTELLIVGLSGALWQWNNAAWSALAGYTLTSAAVTFSAAQGVNKLYIADGTKNIWQWNGTVWTDLLNGPGNAPVASVVLWHTNRLFATAIAANPDTIQASDLLDAGIGAWDQVKFSFQVGAGEGDPIKGIGSLPGSWMIVLKENSLWAVNTFPEALTAADWPIQFLTRGIGCVGKRAYCVVGNDVMFIAQDGFRSVKRMAAVNDVFEVTAPLSQPLQPYIDRINWNYASTSVVRRYLQYVFFSVPLDDATSPNYTFVWNERTQAWMGYWTGWTVQEMETTRFGADNKLAWGAADGYAHHWLDYGDTSAIATFQDAGADIQTLIRTRSSLFAEPFSNKDPWYFEVRFVETDIINNNVSIRFYADETLGKSYGVNVGEENALPLDLPFNLASGKPFTIRKPLTGVEPFNEAYLEITSTAGKLAIKNISMAAFLNTITNE